MKRYFMVLLFMQSMTSKTHLIKRSFAAFNKPSSVSVFNPHPQARAATVLIMCIVIGYAICYIFVGPISPLLYGSKPASNSFGLVRR